MTSRNENSRLTPDENALPRFLSVQEVTEVLGISRQSLYAWMSSGHFPRGKKIGPRRIAWLRSDVEAWMQSREAA